MTAYDRPPGFFRPEEVTQDVLRRIFEARGWHVNLRRHDLTVHARGTEVVIVIVPPSILLTTEFHAPPKVSRSALIETVHQFNLDGAYGRAIVTEYETDGSLGVVFHTDHPIDGGLLAQNIVGKCERFVELVNRAKARSLGGVMTDMEPKHLASSVVVDQLCNVTT